MEVPASLVVDANILFSFFKADSGRRRMIKHLDEEGCRLLSPDYVLEELTGEKDRIKRFANITETEFTFLLSLLERTIHTVDQERYQTAMTKAETSAPHDKDTPYFALAIHANAPIWSDETAFQEQNTVMIYTTDQLYDIIE